MSDHDLLERTSPDLDERTAAFLDFLNGEFPAWDFEVESTSTWGAKDRPLWIATREGHHPQSALTAAKLHRRLEDYEARESARFAGRN